MEVMFKTSDSTAKLDVALAKAQSKIASASKDKVNPAFRSKYADLSAVWEACRSALTANEICVSQWPVHSEDNRLHLITRLACSGEWIMCEFSIPADKQNAHGYGSAITYAKRFSLAAAIGVVADDDDDGNAASGKGDTAGRVTKEATGGSVTSARPAAKHGQMQGPLTITALKAKMREFGHDMEACSDIDSLDALLAQSRGVLDQCERDLPDWYYGVEGGDVKGAQARISDRIAEMKKDQPHDYLKAG